MRIAWLSDIHLDFLNENTIQLFLVPSPNLGKMGTTERKVYLSKIKSFKIINYLKAS